MPEIGYAALPIIPSLKGASGIISRELSASSKTAGVAAGKQLGTSMTEAAAKQMSHAGGLVGLALRKSFAATGIVSVGAALGKALFSGFERLDAIENAEAKLRGLGESAKQVDAIMDSALASVKGTAYGLDAAATAAATAVAAGIKPGQELTRYLTLVGDVATQTNSTFEDSARVMNQAVTVGAAYNETLQSLAQRGLPVYSLLAQSMGKSTAQVKKLASEGKVSADQLEDALRNKIGGAAQKSGDTFDGAMANMGAAASRLGAGLLGGVFPKLQGGITDLTNDLDNLQGTANALGGALGGTVSAIAGIPGPVKAGAAAWLAYSAAQKLGVGSRATSITQAGLGRVKAGITEVRLQAMIAAEAYRTTAASEAAMASGAARATGSLLALRAATTEVGNASVTGLQKGLSGALGLIGGPWGAAVLGGTIAVTKLWQAHQEAKQHVDDLTESLNAQTGALTENTKTTVYDGLAKSGAIDAAKKLGISLGDVTAAALGNEDAFRRVAVAAKDAGGYDAVKVIAGIDDESSALGKSKEAWSDKKTALDGAKRATEAATVATQQNTAAAKANAAAVKADNKAANDSITKFRDIAGAAKDAKGSVASFEKSLRDQAKAMNDFGDNAYRASQRGVKEGLIKQLATLGPEGASILSKLAHGSKLDIDSMNADFTRWWKSGKNAAGKLSAALGGVTHPQWNAKLGIDGVPQALTAVGRLKRQLDGLHDKRLTVTVLTNNAHAAAQQANRKAVGGRVTAGDLYTVGEFGREAFVPSVDGQIIPNDKLNDYGFKPRPATPAAAAPSVSLSHSSDISAPMVVTIDGVEMSAWVNAQIDDRIDARIGG